MPHHTDHPDENLKAEGQMDEMEGKAKATWGDITGDVGDQVAGKAQEAWGKIQQGAGEVMDEVGDAADRTDNRH